MVRSRWYLILFALLIAIIFIGSAAQFRFVQTHRIVKGVECLACHKQEFQNVLNGTHIVRMTPNQTRFIDDYYVKYAYTYTSTELTKEICYSCHLAQQHYDEFALSDPYIFRNLTTNQSEAIYNHTNRWSGGNLIDQIVGSRNNTIKTNVYLSDIQPAGGALNVTIKIALANFSNHQTGPTLFENTSTIYTGEEASLTTPQVYGDYFNVTINLNGVWMSATINVTINGTNKAVPPIQIDTSVTGEYKFPDDLQDYGYPYFHTKDIYAYRRLDSIWLDFGNKMVTNISAYENISTSTDGMWINKPTCSTEDAMCHINQKITYMGNKNSFNRTNNSYYKHNMPYTTTNLCRICHLKISTPAQAIVQAPTPAQAIVQAPTPTSTSLPELSVKLSQEVISRSLIALPQDGGGVYLGWRFFRGDELSTNFNVYRKQEGEKYQVIAQVLDSTNYLDWSAQSGRTYYYLVKPVVNGSEGLGSNEVVVITAVQKRDYVRIPLPSSRGAAAVVAGDLDGDGLFDYVVKTPGVANDGESYHLEAYLSSGSYLWDFDLGIGNDNEGGVWLNSYTVWDVDGDNKAEVIARIKGDGHYYLAVINGLTGELKKRVLWPTNPWSDPSEPGYENWMADAENRHVIAIAYLDGQNPYIILQVGTYARLLNPDFPYNTGRVKLQAYDNDLNLVWAKVALGDGAAGHGIRIIDYDDDGNDEILQGSNLIDESGNLLWTKRLGHVDKMIPGNIDPDNPGYEVFYTQEPYGQEWEGTPPRAGAYLVSMNDGKILWKKEGYTHLHGSDWAADVTKDFPGWELWFHDRSKEGPIVGSYLFSSKATLISNQWLYNNPPIWWDDDNVWELLRESEGRWYILDYPDHEVFQTEGTTSMQGDLMGDHRDELLVTRGNELRIYTNTDISHKKLPTPLQDHYYRLSLSMQGTGYYHNVQLLNTP